METAPPPSADTPNFDSLAHLYRWMEYLSFGTMLERCRFHFLSRCGSAGHALILGDGDGRFTARFLAENPDVRVDAVDASAAMLQALRGRVQRLGPQATARLQTLQADLRAFTPVGSYDHVVTHFFLDCLSNDELDSLLLRTLPHLTPRATWWVSEFAIPQKGWRRWGAQRLVGFLYFAFRLLTGLRVQQIPDYGAIFLCHGFYRREHACFLGGLLVTELWERKDL